VEGVMGVCYAALLLVLVLIVLISTPSSLRVAFGEARTLVSGREGAHALLGYMGPGLCFYRE